MSLSDNIWNSLTGHNIHTIKVSAEQLAAVINDAFIKTASGTEELNRIEHTVKGSKLIFRRMDSEDRKFHLYVSYLQRGLTHHRYVFVKKRICQFIAVLVWVVGIINFVKAYNYMESSSSHSELDAIINFICYNIQIWIPLKRYTVW